MAAESGDTEVFGIAVSTLQDEVNVTGNKITGTLLYQDSGQLVTDWGEGYFLVLKFSNVPETATSVKVGLDPSQSSGLVELLGDPDMNGVFKITDKTQQVFMVVTTDGTNTFTQAFDLSSLVTGEEIGA